MSQLKLKGSVRWMPGPWGSGRPAQDVRIVVHQNSVQPVQKREIWRGTTNSAGVWEGTSSEWRRTVTVRAGAFETTRPDPTDLMALTFDASIGDRGITGPLPYLGDFIPIPPIVLGWEPLHLVLGEFNGVRCYSIAQFGQQASAWIRGGAQSGLQVALQTPMAAALLPGVDQFMDQVCARLNELSRVLSSGALTAANGALASRKTAFRATIDTGIETWAAGGTAYGGVRTATRGVASTMTPGARAGVAAGRTGAIGFGTNMSNHLSSRAIEWLFGIGVAIEAEGLPPLSTLPQDPAGAKRILTSVLTATMQNITAKIESIADGTDPKISAVIQKIIAFLRAILVETPFIEGAVLQSRISRSAEWLSSFLAMFCQTFVTLVNQVFNAASCIIANWHRTQDRIILSMS